MKHDQHRWEKPIRPDLNHTYRTCAKCGIVRITRHEPDNDPPHWSEWERDGAKIAAGKKTPKCEVAA